MHILDIVHLLCLVPTNSLILRVEIGHLILESHLVLLICAILLSQHQVLIIALKCVRVVSQILVDCFVSRHRLLSLYVKHFKVARVVRTNGLVRDDALFELALLRIVVVFNLFHNLRLLQLLHFSRHHLAFLSRSNRHIIGH
jgi:hypothetical protein